MYVSVSNALSVYFYVLSSFGGEMVNKNFGVTNRLQEKAREKKINDGNRGMRWGGWCLGNTTAMEGGGVSSEGDEGRLQRADGWQGANGGGGAPSRSNWVGDSVKDCGRRRAQSSDASGKNCDDFW